MSETDDTRPGASDDESLPIDSRYAIPPPTTAEELYEEFLQQLPPDLRDAMVCVPITNPVGRAATVRDWLLAEKTRWQNEQRQKKMSVEEGWQQRNTDIAAAVVQALRGSGLLPAFNDALDEALGTHLERLEKRVVDKVIIEMARSGFVDTWSDIRKGVVELVHQGAQHEARPKNITKTFVVGTGMAVFAISALVVIIILAILLGLAALSIASLVWVFIVVFAVAFLLRKWREQ